MFDKLKKLFTDRKSRDLAMTAGGVLAVLGGRKITGLSLFGAGLYGLEKQWREVNDFEGTWSERWEQAEAFYEETHQDDTNRLLHIVGIPMIVGGTYGLLRYKPFRPRWAVSWGSFTFGWVLNFIGHGVYKKSAPAFTDDPLSFVAGPMWDLKQFGLRWSDEDVVEMDEDDADLRPVEEPAAQ